MARGLGGKGQPGGLRPETKDSQTKSINTRAPGSLDPKGQKILTGHGPPGRNFKPKSFEEMSREIKIRQAAQEAPEALSQQRIPEAAKDITKDYYKSLGGQGEGKQKSNP